ncbi:MAG TPA: ArsA-related P-loop ATPase [Acidimicrobiales bacterium]|nr:ArsA-related P-loop ATPase [Acidimicrobiales bacterium]
MDPLSFFSQVRVFVVTGKGGVGKTTVSGVMANLASREGLRALVVELGVPGARRQPEVAHLARLFGREHGLQYEQVVLRSRGDDGGEVQARALRPDTALVEYLHLHGMRRLSRRLVSTGALDVVATAVPGMPDILVLGKIKQMERAAAAGSAGAADVIVLDAPAAGHAVRFLQSPLGLLEAAGGGPVRAQAEEVVEMLSDPKRCQVLLVTTPEETPVGETVETAALLEDRIGVKLCGVVVNARFPVLDLPAGTAPEDLALLAEGAGARLSRPESESLAAAASLRLQRQASQAAQVARLKEELPLPQLELPFCFSAELGLDQLEALTDALAASVQKWVPVSS